MYDLEAQFVRTQHRNRQRSKPKPVYIGSIPEFSLEITYHLSYIKLSNFADKWSVSLSGARSDFLQKSTMSSPASLRGGAHVQTETMKGLPQWLWVQ
jgi:hypothetical protein